MEASALEDFLNWAESVNLLAKISVVCCDQDSSTHKLVAEDPRCSKIEIVVDPGHKKKSFQNYLIKLFGKKKEFNLFATRIGSWFMRSLSEAKALSSDRQAIEKEFVRRMSFCVSHYTTRICPRNCPCISLQPLKISKDLLESSGSTIESLVLQEAFVILELDSSELSVVSLVCRQWEIVAENVHRMLEKKRDKDILVVCFIFSSTVS